MRVQLILVSIIEVVENIPGPKTEEGGGKTKKNHKLLRHNHTGHLGSAA